MNRESFTLKWLNRASNAPYRFCFYANMHDSLVASGSRQKAPFRNPAGLPLVFGKAGLLVERGVAEWGSTVVVTRPLHPQKPLVR